MSVQARQNIGVDVDYDIRHSSARWLKPARNPLYPRICNRKVWVSETRGMLFFLGVGGGAQYNGGINLPFVAERVPIYASEDAGRPLWAFHALPIGS